MVKIWLILSVFLVIFTSCNTIINKKTSNYDLVLDKYSKSDYKYDNLFNGRLTVEVIFLSNEIRKALYKDIKKNNLTVKNIPFPIKNNYLTFLVAFYHYNNKFNKLDTQNSIWNITLVINNKNKYRASKITKLFRSNKNIFKTYFKNEQRFSSFYLVEFKSINLSEISQNIKLIFSSIEATLEVTWRL